LGILNLYLEPGAILSSEDGAFLQAILNEMAIALEAVRLREKELSVLRTVRRLEDSQQGVMLQRLLEGLAQTLEADFAVLIGAGLTGESPHQWNGGGSIASRLLISLRDLGESMEWGTQGPRLISESELRDLGIEDVHSLGVIPVPGPGFVIQGTVLFGRYQPPALDLSRFGFLEGLTEVLGMTLQLAGLAGELTYQATMDERARLAREIHDGLAQTLGFLKLTVAQIEGYVVRGEQAKIRPALQACHTSLREAYADARQAIDDLRTSTQLGYVSWVEQAAAELQELDGIRVRCQGIEPLPGLSPEAESQLVRIVQEALTNIRKHAAATEIRVRQWKTGSAWHLEIEDDGRGYDPRDVFGASSHGLVGMRERAELIGARLRLDSAPGAGTRVQIRLPEVAPVAAP
jgi:two-component system nitrate/nitrite sensor histidine kinase NarX